MTSRFVALEDIADISAGNPAPQDAADFSEDGQPFVRMQDVGREHHTRTLTHTADKLTEDAIRRNRLRLYPAGTLLIPKSGASINLNHRALLAQDAYVVSHLATVVPDTSLVDAEYLYFWSLTYDPRSQAQTTSLPSLPTSLIKSAQVPLPPLPEQRRIVDLLSRAEGIVRLRREAQRKAAELVPALFLDMFGDPASNPKGWPVVPLGEIVENKDGRRRPIKSADRDNRQGPYPYYGASGIIDYMDEYIFDETNLLIAEDGANLVSRSTPIAFIAEGKYWVNNHAHVVGETEHADLSFLSWQMNLRDLRDFITGSAQPKLNQSNLNKIPMIAPPIELQRQFAAKADAVRGIAAQQAAALATAQATFEALLHQSFAVP